MAARHKVPVREEVPATAVRGRLTELMNRARYRGDRFVIKTNGKPAVAIIGTDDLARLEKLDGDKAA